MSAEPRGPAPEVLRARHRSCSGRRVKWIDEEDEGPPRDIVQSRHSYIKAGSSFWWQYEDHYEYIMEQREKLERSKGPRPHVTYEPLARWEDVQLEPDICSDDDDSDDDNF